MPTEIRPVPNLPLLADDAGRVWQTGPDGTLRDLNQSKLNNGYFAVHPHIDGRRRTFTVHRLICAAFHGAPEEGMVTRHLDGSKTNNVPTNLTWGRPRDNAADKDRHGRGLKGERHP